MMSFRPTSSATAVLLLFLAVLLLAADDHRASAAVQCGQVTQLMAPCMPYLAGAPGTPYGRCCNGLGMLNRLAATPTDRVAACNCVRASAGAGFPAIDFVRAAGLPAACGLSISFAITPNMDCNQVG